MLEDSGGNVRLNGKIFAVLIWAALAFFSYAIVKINPGDEFRRNVPEGGGSAVPGTAPVSPASPAPGVSEQPVAPAKPAPTEGARKVEVLREILASKNDNDPRRKESLALEQATRFENAALARTAQETLAQIQS